jgi:hypothetical protein
MGPFETAATPADAGTTREETMAKRVDWYYHRKG